MAYIINKYNGEILVSLQDGTLDTTTSLSLLGRNYTGYGEVQNENFLFLLENFANDTAPLRPLIGQIWYDTSNESLKTYDGTNWNIVGTASVESTSPTETLGALWFNTTTQQFFIYNGTEWTLIGPESLENFGETKLSSRELIDTSSGIHAAALMTVDDQIVSVYSKDEYTLEAGQIPQGFTEIKKGINLRSDATINGDLEGTAQFADQLKTPRNINGVQFDGTQDITIQSNTTGTLQPGDYINGNSFNGSADITWNISASSNNTLGTLVARDNQGNFSARTVTADLVGDVTGNVTASSGTSTFNRIEANEIVGLTFSGNSFTAQKLQTARKINGVDFNGTQDITVPASASTLTGNTLSSNVTESNLQTLGVLASLDIGTTGINVNEKMTISASGSPTVTAVDEIDFTININSPLKIVDGDKASLLGGDDVLTLYSQSLNIGLPTIPVNKVYASELNGVASSAQYADLAEKYESDKMYEPGTVLIFGGEKQVKNSDKINDHRVAGVVSENPAYLMNNEATGNYVVPVALQGLVPCKVVGYAKKGDLLVTSHLNGIAIVNNTPAPGTIIGKMIEDKNNDGVDKVMIVVGKH